MGIKQGRNGPGIRLPCGMRELNPQEEDAGTMLFINYGTDKQEVRVERRSRIRGSRRERTGKTQTPMTCRIVVGKHCAAQRSACHTRGGTGALCLANWTSMRGRQAAHGPCGLARAVAQRRLSHAQAAQGRPRRGPCGGAAQSTSRLQRAHHFEAPPLQHVGRPRGGHAGRHRQLLPGRALQA